MKNAALFPEMTVLKCLNYLHKYFPDNILVHEIFIFFGSPYQLLYISAFAVLHNYVYRMLLFFYDSKFELLYEEEEEKLI